MKMILFFIVLLFPTVSGLSISRFNGLTQRSAKTHNDKWMIIKDEPSNKQINQRNNQRQKVLAVYEFNHQECDMVLKPRRRRRVKCHDELTNHGRNIGLFRPFATAAKWLEDHWSDILLTIHEIWSVAFITDKNSIIWNRDKRKTYNNPVEFWDI